MVEDKSKYLLLDIDDFRRQKVVTAAQGYANQILTLLSLKRGDIPSIPDAYIDISKALRYKDMDLITGGALKERIVDKIRTYLPEVPLDSLNEIKDTNIIHMVYDNKFYILCTKILTKQ